LPARVTVGSRLRDRVRPDLALRLTRVGCASATQVPRYACECFRRDPRGSFNFCIALYRRTGICMSGKHHANIISVLVE
jgi:hypothetical protein